MLIALAALLGTSTGCTWISYLGTDVAGVERGQTWYLGGAGPFGHVGTIDVPKGLRDAGYRGAIEVFGWQGVLPSTLRDQTDRERNEYQGQRLAERVIAYQREFPGQPVNIIALSAGTGVATWALESLPEDARVDTVIFLGSSIARDYDLRPALGHVRKALYNFYSPDDPILRYGVPVAGSVDRRTRDIDVAGVLGFAPPAGVTVPVGEFYGGKLRNMPYRQRYRRFGWKGRHTDTTSVEFVEHVLAPLLMGGSAMPEVYDEAPTSQPGAAGVQ